MADYQSYKKIQGDQAIIANSVGPAQVTGISTGIVRKDYYYNRCWWSVDNGGCCYLWTVPQGTTTIQFEIVLVAVAVVLVVAVLVVTTQVVLVPMVLRSFRQTKVSIRQVVSILSVLVVLLAVPAVDAVMVEEDVVSAVAHPSFRVLV